MRHKDNYVKRIKEYILQFFKVFSREFGMIFRDEGVILFFAFLPLAYPIIYSLIYNPELVRDVRTVIVDHDRSAESREFVRKIGATEEVRVLGYAADLNEARHAMNSHDCYGILEIPEGFGRDIGRGEQANAVLYCEMSLMLRYRGYVMACSNVALDMGSEIREEMVNTEIPMAMTLVDGDPMPITGVSMGNTQSGFDSFIMLAVLVLILHQCIVLAVGMMGGAMHENPAKVGYDPWNYAPSVVCTLLGKTCTYFFILIFPAVFLLYYVPLMFSFPMAGNMFEIFAYITPMVLAAIFLGFALQGAVRQRESIFLIWVVTSVFFLFLSGITWPRYAMHGFWRWLSDIVPATWGVEGYVRMSSNGASLSQNAGCYEMLWILAGAYFLIAVAVHKFSLRPSVLRLRERYGMH